MADAARLDTLRTGLSIVRVGALLGDDLEGDGHLDHFPTRDSATEALGESLVLERFFNEQDSLFLGVQSRSYDDFGSQEWILGSRHYFKSSSDAYPFLACYGRYLSGLEWPDTFDNTGASVFGLGVSGGYSVFWGKRFTTDFTLSYETMFKESTTHFDPPVDGRTWTHPAFEGFLFEVAVGFAF